MDLKKAILKTLESAAAEEKFLSDERLAFELGAELREVRAALRSLRSSRRILASFRGSDFLYGALSLGRPGPARVF